MSCGSIPRARMPSTLARRLTPGAQAAARKRGYDLTHCAARQVTADDFREFDLILAMDWDNLAALQQQCPKAYQHKLMLLMRFANEFEEATVPDPIMAAPRVSARCSTIWKTPVRACWNFGAQARHAIPGGLIRRRPRRWGKWGIRNGSVPQNEKTARLRGFFRTRDT